MPVPALPPATAKELERAEVHCYDKRADECERAASAYEAGRFGAPDQERAERLRKVALTFLVRACEKRSPHACYALAGRYQAGVGVQASERKARALLEHARELCRNKPGPECVAGEPR
jgi:TPR repeat protein